MSHFRSLYSHGALVVPGVSLLGLGMSRAFPFEELTTARNCRIIYVDSSVDTGHKDYRDGLGDSWRNACSTVQAGVNYARYDFGTTTISYDDDHHTFVIVAPGNYAERVSFSGKNIHLIGLGIPGSDTGVTLDPVAPSTFAFAASGTGLEIANMCITEGTAVFGMYLPPAEASIIRDMLIIDHGGVPAMTYGIYGGSTGLKGTCILNNRIAGPVTSGIYYPSDASAYAIDGFIRGNIIGGTVVKGIDIDITTCYAFVICENFINGTSSASIETASTGILVCNNWVDRQPSGTLTERDNHYSSAGG
jgi:hypothetical protein